jgi:hypothetical protein
MHLVSQHHLHICILQRYPIINFLKEKIKTEKNKKESHIKGGHGKLVKVFD